MGTRIVLAAYTVPDLDAARVRAALEAAFAEIVRLEALMTTWRDDSEISRLNRAAGKGAVTLSPDTYAVLDKSLWISRASEGVFDVTFASMGKLWKFDQDREARLPDRSLVETARRRIDYRRITLDPATREARLTSPETQVNLGGIAKGYAIDRAAEVLRRAGLAAFFAQAGGDLYVAGKKPWGEPWRVGVRDPRGPDGSAFAMLAVEDHAFSTAGDYERSFILDGKRYHHILDPRTGWPATASRSVTIWAEDALTADAIDDAVFILGPDKGLALVESIDGCGAVIVDAANKVWVSRRLEKLVELRQPPTEGI
ncbi:MAG: FAD:protein FMN transferase [Myxococcales bacterium]|nr:FAD:protein FMN transferase [Myxococcales bacterium]